MANKIITKSNEWLTHIMKYYDNKSSISKTLASNTKLFLGLDISTSSTGYSLIDSNSKIINFNKIGELKKFGIIEPPKDSSVFDIADNICQKIDKDIIGNNKDLKIRICIEDFMKHFSGNNWTTQNLFKLSQINGIVHYHCMKEIDPLVFQIHPSIPRHFFHLITQRNPSSESKTNKISPIKTNGFNFVSLLIPSFDWPKTKTGVYKSSCYDMSDSYILSLYCYYMNNFEELISDNSFYIKMKELYNEKQNTRLEKLKLNMKEDEFEKYVNEKVRDKLLLEYNNYVMEKYEYNEIINKILPQSDSNLNDKNNAAIDNDENINDETHPKFIEKYQSKKGTTKKTNNNNNNKSKKIKDKKNNKTDGDNNNELKDTIYKPRKQQQHKDKDKSTKSKSTNKSFKSFSNDNNKKKMTRKTTHKTYKRSFHTSIMILNKENGIMDEVFNTNISMTDEDIKSIKSISEKMYGNEEDLFNQSINEYPSSLGLTDEEKSEFIKALNQKVYEKYGINGDLNTKNIDEIAKDIKDDIEKLENEDDKEILERIKNGESIGNYDRLFNKYHKPKK